VEEEFSELSVRRELELRRLSAKRLRLRQQLGLLSSREKAIFEKEMALINQLERLEKEEASPEAQEPPRPSLSGPTDTVGLASFSSLDAKFFD
jgi:hypothetical protein